MKTIKLPVTVNGIYVQDADKWIAFEAWSNDNHDQKALEAKAAELAAILNSHDAFVKVARAVVKAADAQSTQDVADILTAVLDDAKAALKLAEGK